MTSNNDDKKREERRRQILFFAGLIGLFLYLGLVELASKDFHAEVLIIFGTMMGISIIQGVDRK